MGDTGVLLNLLAYYGHEILPQLAGMWAFAFYNARDKRLLISRDRFGIKPLYYKSTNQHIAIASTEYGVACLLDESIVPCRDAISNMLISGFKASGSFVNDLNVFPPASYCVIDVNNFRQLSFSEYYSISPTRSVSINPISRFVCLLENVISEYTYADVPVSLSLSGGLDSSLIAACAVSTGSFKSGTAYNIDTGDSTSESEFAMKASRKLNINLKVVSFNPSKVDYQFHKESLFNNGSPCVGYSHLMYSRLMLVMSRDRYKVCLSGQGADEAFLGYSKHLYASIFSALYSKNTIDKKNIQFYMSNLFSCSLLTRLSPSGINKYVKRYFLKSLLRRKAQNINFNAKLSDSDSAPEGLNLLQRINYDEIKYLGLPTMLCYEDRMSMQYGVEVRVPFLDHRIFDYALALSPQVLIQKGLGKILIRDALKYYGLGEISSRRRKYGMNINERLLSKNLANFLLEDETVLNPLLVSTGIIPAEQYDYALNTALSYKIERQASEIHCSISALLNAEAWLRAVRERLPSQCVI